MAKKLFKGYKGKTSSKFIAAGITAGVISLAILGGTVASKLSNRPEPEHPYNDNFLSESVDGTLENLTPEPPINMEEGEYTPENTLPELQEPIIPDDSTDVETTLGVEFVEVLAKLTNKSKDYIASVTGNTPNLTISGLTSMKVNSNNGEVRILGQVSVGNNFNHFIATMNNIDTSLKVYNLSADSITEDEFVGALDELISAEGTQFKLQLKQYIKLSNESEVIDNILQSRLDELNALNSTDPAILEEIEHLTTLLENNNLKLNVLLNNSQVGENGYDYSFGMSVNTGKYLYSVNQVIASNRVLNTTALKHAIEQYLDFNNEFKVDATSSSSINQALYVISDTAFDLENENTLNQ